MSHQPLLLPAEIDAHLMNLALDGVGVALHVSELRLIGRFDLPDDFAEVAFLPETRHRPLDRGCAVRVEYAASLSGCRFSTRVLASTLTGRLRLARPHAVERYDRRARARTDLRGRERWRFVDTGGAALSGLVQDVSPMGCALQITPGERAPRRGHTLSGWLHLDRAAAMPVTLEVRHLTERGDGTRIVGVRFAEIRRADRRRLAELLGERDAAALRPGRGVQVA